MCGRYELHSHPAAIALTFGLAHPPDVHARYNIAPMTDVPVVRVECGRTARARSHALGSRPALGEGSVDRHQD